MNIEQIFNECELRQVPLCTLCMLVLHSVPTTRDKERGSPHIWFFSVTQTTVEKTLANQVENGGLSLPDLEKGEAI